MASNNLNTSDEMSMKAFADEIKEYVISYVRKMPEVALAVKTFTATVTAAASEGKITVQRPFETSTFSLPYVGSMAEATVGSVVTVAVLGGSSSSMSNAIIIGDGTLSNL